MDVTAVRCSKLWLFTGPELLVSMAFLNLGNLEGDLLAGATIGHPLLL
jgi:natural resistance-associated macrophage protein